MAYEILITETVGDSFFEEGVTEKWIARQFKEANGDDVEIYINSLGGDVKHALGIQSHIIKYVGHTKSIITGIAASALSWVAISCDEVTMNEHSFLVIHNTMSETYGNYQAHEKKLNVLEMIDTQFRDMYANKTGLSIERIKAMMDSETWFSADEALENGFIDSVNPVTSETIVTLENAVSLGRFVNCPKSLIASSANNKVKKPRKTSPENESEKLLEVERQRNRRLQNRLNRLQQMG